MIVVLWTDSACKHVKLLLEERLDLEDSQMLYQLSTISV